MTDFAALYHQEAAHIRQHMYVHVFADWEDVASSVWLKALESAARGNSPRRGHEEGWLWSIVGTKLVDYYRNKDKLRREQPLESIVDELRHDGGLVSPEIGADLARVCQQAQLTEAEREVFDMRYIQGFRFREIAEMQQSNINAIRARHMRGMRKIRTVAGENYGE